MTASLGLLSAAAQLAELLGARLKGAGHDHAGAQAEAPATVLNSLMGVVRVAGKIGIPGPYVNEAPDDVNAAAKMGGLDDDEFDAGVPKKVCD